jgi:hypothetical protein
MKTATHISLFRVVLALAVKDSRQLWPRTGSFGVGMARDFGGKDEYGCGVENNSYNQRGSAGGFVIDRPKRDEGEQQAASPPTAKKNNG